MTSQIFYLSLTPSTDTLFSSNPYVLSSQNPWPPPSQAVTSFMDDRSTSFTDSQALKYTTRYKDEWVVMCMRFN